MTSFVNDLFIRAKLKYSYSKIAENLINLDPFKPFYCLVGSLKDSDGFFQ